MILNSMKNLRLEKIEYHDQDNTAVKTDMFQIRCSKLLYYTSWKSQKKMFFWATQEN